MKQLKDECFSPRVVALAEENEAHSDDELDPASPSNAECYLIHEKTGRNSVVSALFYYQDEHYKQSLRRKRGSRCVGFSSLLKSIR